MRIPIVALQTVAAVSLMAPCLLVGCYIKVDKSKNGEDKDVTIHVPMGGLHVEQNATVPKDIGLPAYPGASVRNDDHGSNSADVHVGFGDWQLHVRAAKYKTADPQPKVAAFYRSALAQYGQVLECRDGAAVGSEKVTRDGLSCDDKHPESRGIYAGSDDTSFDLRAGSRRHQHIVGFEAARGGETEFTLLQVDLPVALEKRDHQE